jgi:hypothetical protein
VSTTGEIGADSDQHESLSLKLKLGELVLMIGRQARSTQQVIERQGSRPFALPFTNDGTIRGSRWEDLAGLCPICALPTSQDKGREPELPVRGSSLA